jgi:competence ComEA-like helix-hairpin-helix protein
MTVTEEDSGRVVRRVEAGEGALAAGEEGWGWTVGQRVGLGVMVLVLIGILGWGWWRRPAVIGEGSVVVDGGMATLPMRIDPNVASEKELSRIPHVGEKIAAKIVAFREEHGAEGVVFRRVDDLRRVDGVGKGLVELLRPYLEIGEDGAAESGVAGGDGG